MQVNKTGIHVPVVYDREFYRDIFREYASLLGKAKAVRTFVPYHQPPSDDDGTTTTLDPRRQQQQFEKFCVQELGFRVSEIGNFAVHFGWEGAWVGPLHVVGTATKNTYSQWLSIFHTLGIRDVFEQYIMGFKIDVRTMIRSCRGGEKLVTASVWSDAGDLIDAVTNARVFPIKQPDTMTKVELQDAYDNYLSDVDIPDRTPENLIAAVAKKDGVPVELMSILLMCEHLYSCMCKTVWSADESWEKYIERVRVYDPTASSFKRIHYALVFGHGLDCVNAFGDNNNRYRMRPAPSQQNIVHGQGVSA